MMSSYGTDTSHLVAKRQRMERQPFEACGAACVATVAFVVAFLCLAFGLRYSDFTIALILGVGFFGLLGLVLILLGVRQYFKGRPARAFVMMGFSAALGALAGYYLADKTWWKYTVSYYNYEDMGSYVNVDPGLDVGQSFMDAGTVYFKDGSYVLKRKALAFHNGITYCIAPIVRQPVQLTATQSNPFVLDTVTGFVPPRSGTVDWWAVGTNCCGTTGTDEPFTCGDAESVIARTGLRVLDNHQRAMYLLGTQEWSASTGLPVRHPMFFEWVKDPIERVQTYYSSAWTDFLVNTAIVFLASLVVAFILQIVLTRCKCRAK